jgi:hypothetical protein
VKGVAALGHDVRLLARQVEGERERLEAHRALALVVVVVPVAEDVPAGVHPAVRVRAAGVVRGRRVGQRRRGARRARGRVRGRGVGGVRGAEAAAPERGLPLRRAVRRLLGVVGARGGRGRLGRGAGLGVCARRERRGGEGVDAAVVLGVRAPACQALHP